jgi:hypothetical protein
MIKSCLHILLFLLPCALLPGQDAVCGYRWLSEQQDSATSLRVAYASRLLDSLARNATVEHRAEIVIPVVVHVVWQKPDENISDERIFSQIEALNRDFNGENTDLYSVPKEFEAFISKQGIRFCLAAADPQGEPTSGIIRVKTGKDAIGTKNELYSTASGGSDAWDTQRYLNIWVANTGDFLTGFGTYPGQVSPDREGLVIHPRYFGRNNSNRYKLGRVAVHEAGHYFGILHPWSDDEDCSTDDGVADTPPQLAPHKGCPAHPQMSCGNADMFMNFMDYVDGECMVMFTKGQMDRMMNTIEAFRPGLVSANASCVGQGGPKSEPVFTLSPNPSTGTVQVKLKNNSSEISRVEIYNSVGQMVFQITTVLFDGAQLDLPNLIAGVYFVKIGCRLEKLAIK